jgi:thiol-disulfide isomerase/thioredoxin
MKSFNHTIAAILIGTVVCGTMLIMQTSRQSAAAATATSAPKKTAVAKKPTPKPIKKPVKKPAKKTVKKLVKKPVLKKTPVSTVKPFAVAKPVTVKPATPTPAIQKPVSKNLLGVDKLEFTLKSTEGPKYTNKEIFTNNKLTMINFWGITCTPCIKELPDLQELNDELASKKFGVLGIVGDVQNVDDKESANLIIEKKSIKFVNLIPDASMADNIISKMSGFPVSVFVDKNGNIVGEIITGTRTKEEYKKIIEDLLGKM